LPLIIHFKSVQPPFTILTQDLLQQQWASKNNAMIMIASCWPVLSSVIVW
jgi:hypothetical protein